MNDRKEMLEHTDRLRDKLSMKDVATHGTPEPNLKDKYGMDAVYLVQTKQVFKRKDKLNQPAFVSAGEELQAIDPNDETVLFERHGAALAHFRDHMWGDEYPPRWTALRSVQVGISNVVSYKRVNLRTDIVLTEAGREANNNSPF